MVRFAQSAPMTALLWLGVSIWIPIISAAPASGARRATCTNETAVVRREWGLPLPVGWPKRLEGPLVWEGKDLLAQPERWIHILTPDELLEVDAALQHFKHLEIPHAALTREHFPLPHLGQVLRQISHELYQGTGLYLLRGVPVEKYSPEDVVAICLGINAWVGDQRLPQGLNRGLCHIMSITHLDPQTRGKIFVSAQNADAQMYHSDSAADIVSLMAVAIPGEGGESKVASSWKVYNHLAKHRPDILRILGERKFRWQSKGIPPEGVRLIHWFQEKLLLNLSTRPFIGYAEVPDRDPNFPELTWEEREAFAGFNWVADQFSLTIKLQNGDIEWVNNLVLQHARAGYIDNPEEPRHLLRVWLRDSELSPALPDDIKNKFDAIFEEPADFIPLDEWEEDRRREQTAIFTASCESGTAEERLLRFAKEVKTGN
ncbi:taurine catabolism dioxygenase family protein [Aspergillus ellipticus CBS 707.79]|uniref:Taurine catabolism dioxygenase family protein n=1 Tax=Aspergillus ellipticus CBS 707.79 TaxID=1448320 RepID=A0A319EAX7_9EURO|nr:taurine catabolism dioxygenase family protein [Aspergillus ellipticus CBS 707.79]